MTLFYLALIAGGPVFAGFIVVYYSDVTDKTRSFLMTFSAGILAGLFVEIGGRLTGELRGLAFLMTMDYPAWWDLVWRLVMLAAGLSAGFLGLAFFKNNLIGKEKDELLPSKRARRAALLWAAAAGLHNLSGGLALGTESFWKERAFSLFLALGFGLQGLFQGFNITAPIVNPRPGARLSAGLALVAGLPVFLGAGLGGLFAWKILETFILSLAAGTVLFAACELIYAGRRLRRKTAVDAGLLAGFLIIMTINLAIMVGE
ncbi:MAG: hypothetical protein HY747_03265 [Elusimicrobia bacterium]|nr:hypothetical protein [Elusimicrobiota bacterium]